MSDVTAVGADVADSPPSCPPFLHTSLTVSCVGCILPVSYLCPVSRPTRASFDWLDDSVINSRGFLPPTSYLDHRTGRSRSAIWHWHGYKANEIQCLFHRIRDGSWEVSNHQGDGGPKKQEQVPGCKIVKGNGKYPSVPPPPPSPSLSHCAPCASIRPHIADLRAMGTPWAPQVRSQGLLAVDLCLDAQPARATAADGAYHGNSHRRLAPACL